MNRRSEGPSELEDAVGRPSGWSGWSDYRRALWRTNRTGLASLSDYKITFAGLARERREWLCATASLHYQLSKVADEMRGIGTINIHRPGTSLPVGLRQELAHLTEVVFATGTQILEIRDSSDPRAAQFSVQARMECATWYLALGDPEGAQVRERIWEREGRTWHLTNYATDLAQQRGMSKPEYVQFRSGLKKSLPPAEEIGVAWRAEEAPALRGSPSARRARGPWITYEAVANLLAS